MRGEAEKKCFDSVKKIIFYNSDGTILSDYNNKTFLNIDDKTFHNDFDSYCRFNKNAFGLSKSDRIEIAELFRKAKPNENESAFPDFIAENGFIEHFQVTSSKENRNGAQQKIEEKKFLRQAEKNEKEFIDECDNSNQNCTGMSVTTQFESPEHNYIYFKKSLIQNFEKHLNSLELYNGNKSISVFMIEYNELLSTMFEDIYNGLPEHMTWGDLRTAQQFRCYRLSRDRDMLQHLYKYHVKVKYIVYVYSDLENDEDAQGLEKLCSKEIIKIEIIKLENIPYIIKLLPWNFNIQMKGLSEKRTTYCISIERKTNE